MKIAKVPYKGTDVEIELNDDLSLGDVDDIVNKYVKADNIMGGEVKIDIVGYRYALALTTVKKAPWKVDDLITLKDLPLKTGRAVVKEASKLYPLKDCLLDWVSTFAGEMTPEQKTMMKEQIENLIS